MPLVEKQVEHLARLIRSLLSPKEKESLTSKVNADAVHFDLIMNFGNSVSVALGVIY